MIFMNTITSLDIMTWLGNHIISVIIIIFIILSCFFEVSKVKVSPISRITKLLFKPIKKDIDDMKAELKTDISNMEERLSKEIDSVKDEMNSEHKRIDDLISSTELSEISRIRWNIIEFSNSIDNNQKHVRDEYRHIKDEAKRYHELIKKYDLDNGIVDEEMEKIDEHYDKNKSSTSVYF